MGASWSTDPISLPKSGDSPLHLITSAAASLRLSPALSLPSVEVALQNFLTSNPFCDRKLPSLDPFPLLEQLWHKIVSDTKAIQYQFRSANFAFINANANDGTRKSEKSRNDPSKSRNLTNVLLILNVLCFAAQVASEGRLLLWGAKINSLIEKGQLWRLVTSSMLHANIIHLLVNCYSLSSVGPTVEKLCGPNRFLAVYAISAITSSATSYLFCKSPSIGASGAIFGLVGCTAVFIARHRELMGGGNEQMMHIGQVILLNMAIGLMANGIDNWGHLGGLVGGAATSWFLGPAWKLESSSYNGKRVFVDQAPIRLLSNLPNRIIK